MGRVHRVGRVALTLAFAAASVTAALAKLRRSAGVGSITAAVQTSTRRRRVNEGDPRSRLGGTPDHIEADYAITDRLSVAAPFPLSLPVRGPNPLLPFVPFLPVDERAAGRAAGRIRICRAV